MPLSEHEQRILEEIERRLAEEDPKFARTTTRATPRGVAVGRIKRAVFAFLAGFGILLAGLIAGGGLLVPLGLVAFGVMLAGVVFVAQSARDLGSGPATGERPADRNWFDRFEERWRKRFERPGDGS